MLAVVGDGGFQMTMCELATACIHKLPVKVLVLNNHYLGMVRQWQEMFYEDRESGVDLHGNPDFARLADCFEGARGFTLKRAADVKKILSRALEYNDGPAVINAEVEKSDERLSHDSRRGRPGRHAGRQTDPETGETDRFNMSTTTSFPAAESAETTDESLHTLSVFVANKPGVLARIAQVFARRGFNIESLVVSAAIDGSFSRMTVGVRGDPERLAQIIAQLNKLVDTLHCLDHTGEDAVVRELALVKIACKAEERSEALQIVEHFNCKTVDLTDTSMIISASGDSDKVDAFVRMISKFKVVEQVRTGKVVMARGDKMT